MPYSGDELLVFSVINDGGPRELMIDDDATN